MSTLAGLLEKLQRLNIKIQVSGGKLAFKAPKGRLTPALKGELREQKGALIAYLAKSPPEPVSSCPFPPVRVRRAGQEPPLSFAQQRLWFLDRLKQLSTAYNEHGNLDFKGPLDCDLLARVLDALVARHEPLRTTFALSHGQPYQKIGPQYSLKPELTDLSLLEADAREAALADAVRIEIGNRFDLERGPLLRVRLLRLDAGHHLLLINIHHIVVDGWSMVLFKRELLDLYTSFQEGNLQPPPPPPVQYADYTVTQRRWLEGPVAAGQLSYWRAKLADAPPLSTPPTDRPRPRVQTSNGATLCFQIPASLTAGIETLGRDNGVTLFMTTLSIFYLLLFRHTAKKDLVVGTPIANRRRSELESMLGFFVNPLALRADLSGNPSFVELLARIRQMTLEGYNHQDIPFERLVEELEPERNPAHSPLFQVVFVLQNMPAKLAAPPGLEVRSVTVDSNTSKLDIWWSLEQIESGVEGIVEYNSDLFEQHRIERMIGHYLNLLDAAVKAPETPIGRLSMLTDAEMQTLSAWNHTARTFADTALAHQLFERRAQANPNSVASVCDGEALTYGEIERRANRLAGKLRSMGLGLDRPAAVYLPPSNNRITAMLAIMKAAGVYLPLDPDYPRERLLYIMGDASPLVLLTESSLFISGQAPVDMEKIDGPKIICLDLPLEEPTGNPPAASISSPDQLAYIIYTSGSTGRPKGVALNHRGLCNLISAQQRVFRVTSGSRVLQFASPGFDASVWEMFMSLGSGATLHLGSRENLQPGFELEYYLDRHRITHLTLPPSALTVMDAARLSHLEVLIVAGEACPRSVAADWSAGRRFFNAYGPTETTVCASMHQVEGLPDSRGPSIGGPIDNFCILLLSEDLEPVPIGGRGEICVAGPGLARGYIGRPDLTAAAFVPSPFGEPGQRLYRTGDQAVFDEQGRLFFSGRIDNQVKMRGFRIELGEIESVLLEHPLVREAVVMLGGKNEKAGNMAAYLLLDRNEAGMRSRARGFAGKQLDRWSEIFDENYRPVEMNGDPSFNIHGWKSSYTGNDMPAAEMNIWRDRTVACIRELKPRRVLEIGAGSGLLLFPLAPHCEAYWGTDFSLNTIHALQAHAQRLGLDQVQLLHRDARNLDELPEAWFDLIVINSVAQYFPNVDFLYHLLLDLASLLAPDGRIFLGDLRNRDLLPAFYLSLELEHADAQEPFETLLQGAEDRAADERELAIAPDFFRALVADHPPFSNVRFMLKRGDYDNELSRFRYDLILETGSPNELQAPAVMDWERDVVTLAMVEDRLQAAPRQALAVIGVPGALAAQAVRALELATADPAKKAAAPQTFANQPAVDPEPFWRMAEGRNLNLGSTWSATYGATRYDLLFTPPGVAVRGVEPAGRERDWSAFANDPTLQALVPGLVRELGEHLADFLPDYMVPATMEVLSCLPRTAAGKVDRFSLSRRQAKAAGGHSRPAHTPLEKQLASIWQDVLEVEYIGCDDNFFSIGGHSLPAVRVITRISENLGFRINVGSMFEYQTVSRLAAHLETLERDQRATPSPPVIDPGPAPPSFGQQRLMFLDLLERDSPFYNMSLIYRLEGPLDVPALERAVNEIANRHDVLRTTFRTGEEGTVQVIAPEQHIPLRIVPLDDPPDDVIAARLETLVDEPFDLETGPLLRVHLLCPNPNDHLLVIVKHHIVSDGWSMANFKWELTRHYNRLTTQGGEALPPLPIQYAEFARRQREDFETEPMQRSREYWACRLNAAPGILELPTDRPRPARRTFDGALFSFEFGEDLARGLEARGRVDDTSLFMTMLTAFAVFLSRQAGMERLLIGAPVANRDQRQLEPLIGLFVNTLIFDVNLKGAATFQELSHRVRSTVLEAFEHNYPFEKLVEELRPERNLGRSPLFQVMLAMQNMPDHPLELHDLRVTAVDSPVRTSKFDLTLFLEPHDHGMTATFEYNTNLFDAATMARWAGEFLHLAVCIAKESVVPLTGELLLDETALNEAWYGPSLPREAVNIHDLIARQAALVPGRPALIHGDCSISFAEINRQADHLAGRLAARGVAPDQVVGVMLERSPQLTVALVAVLKAGAAFLPLDPDYPEKRLEYMIRDARPGCIIHAVALAGQTLHGAKLLSIDTLMAGAPSQAPPSARPSAHNLAYVIYTSGSTGRPKGVMNTHGAILNRLLWMQEEYNPCDEDRVLHKTPVNFDVSVWEIFWPLTHGITTIQARPGGHRDSRYLLRLIAEFGVTICHFVPSMLEMFLDEPQIAAASSLERVICSGEVLSPDLRRRFYEKLPAAWLHNLYGPTEAAIDVTSWACGTSSDRDPVPIGRPIANTSILILDDRMRAAPPGVPGDLYIGGAGPARGYLNRPGAAAAAFLPNPHGKEPGDRIYNTGDIARYRPVPGGRPIIEFLGRRDHQVKLRGVRIELGEIESVLHQHPQVNRCVVQVEQGPAREPVLCAYVTPSGDPPDPDALRGHLRQFLPEAMVCPHLTVLPELPLLANGKIDRKALTRTPIPLTEEAPAPRSRDERMIQDALAKELGVESLDVSANFFDLGAHSLLLTRVHRRLEPHYGERLALIDFFHFTKVRLLAQYLVDGQTAPPKRPAGFESARRDRLEMARRQRRLRQSGTPNPTKDS